LRGVKVDSPYVNKSVVLSFNAVPLA
jgi:hypothetical protein